MNRYDFPQDAACVGLTDVMFPPGIPGPPPRKGPKPDRYVEARKVCARCPVFDACREHYTRPGVPVQREGMVAGMNPKQLARARSARRQEIREGSAA